MKAKKVLCTIMALSMTFALAACGSGNDAGAGGSAGTTGGNGAAKEIVLAHTYAETHATTQLSYEFADFIKEKSGGSMTVSVFPNSALGGDDETLEMNAMGTVQMGVPSVASLETYDSRWAILNLPFLYTSADQMFAAMDGDLGEYMKGILGDSEFIILGYNSNSNRDFTNNVRPITNAQDIKGIKIRCMNNNTYVTWLNALGANATPMGFNELFTAMQQGTVDGQENGPDQIFESAFYEVQKYLTVDDHVYDMNAITVNRAFYEGLTDEERAIFDEGVQTILVDKQRETIQGSLADYIAKLEEKGMQVNTLDDAAKQTFKDALADTYASYEESMGSELWDMVRSYQ